MRVVYLYYLENYRSDAFLTALSRSSGHLTLFDFVQFRNVFRGGSSRAKAHREHVSSVLRNAPAKVSFSPVPALSFGTSRAAWRISFVVSLFLALLWAVVIPMRLLFQRVDRIVCYNGHPLFLPMLLLARLKGVPLTTDLGDLLYLIENPGHLGFSIEMAFLKASERIICVSMPSKRHLCEVYGFDSNSISVMSAALTARFTEAFDDERNAERRFQLRERIGAAVTEPIFAYSGGRWFREVEGRGRVDVQGLDHLVRVVCGLNASGFCCHLVIIGVPSDDADLNETISDENRSRIHILGRYKPLDSLHTMVLGGSDLLCIPSADTMIYKLYDRFKMYEYAAAGKTCIVAEGEINRHVYGDFALYYKDGDETSLANALRDSVKRAVLFEPRLNRIAAERYSWAHRVDEGTVNEAVFGKQPIEVY